MNRCKRPRHSMLSPAKCIDCSIMRVTWGARRMCTCAVRQQNANIASRGATPIPRKRSPRLYCTRGSKSRLLSLACTVSVTLCVRIYNQTLRATHSLRRADGRPRCTPSLNASLSPDAPRSRRTMPFWHAANQAASIYGDSRVHAIILDDAFATSLPVPAAALPGENCR